MGTRQSLKITGSYTIILSTINGLKSIITLISQLVIGFSIVTPTAKETPGWENSKFDVLEMSYDKFMQPVIIPITPDIDIESHLEDWCRKYCQFHGFKLIEVQDDNGILRVKKERADIANMGGRVQCMVERMTLNSQSC
jgi:hypothetical protein